MKLIDKDVLIAEIERRVKAHKETLKNCDSNASEIALKGSISAYLSLWNFLCNLEVKEIDSEKNSEYPFKKGDKVIIHCRAERHKDNVTFKLFDNKVGTVQYIWELKTNPWGNIGVIIDGGYSDMFYTDELELVPKEKEAQKGEQYE